MLKTKAALCYNELQRTEGEISILSSKCCKKMFIFATSLFFAGFDVWASFVSAQTITLPEVVSKTRASASSALMINVALDPSTFASSYKVKIKVFGELEHEKRLAAGTPFVLDAIAPGYYDLVIEANGHTTFVKEDVIKIEKNKLTQIDVEMMKAKTIFLEGDATKIIMCSACHKKIYKEMVFGEGADFHTGPWPGPDGELIHLPDLQRDFYPNSSPEHLAYVSPMTVASIAKEPLEKQDACRACHAPTLILQGEDRPKNPKLREDNRLDGVSCASCHLDKDGNVNGKYDLSAPHPTVQNPLFTEARSAELCAACHQSDDAAPAQQTFLEWRTDFAPKDDRTCQTCHMPREVRLFSEIFSDRPKRAIGRHLFAGGHSPSMLKKAATLSLEQDPEHPEQIHIGVTNSGAGHSLPTGHGSRAVLLHVKIEGPDGTVLLDSKPSTPLAVYAVHPGLGAPSDIIHPAIRAGATEKVTVKLSGQPGQYRMTAGLFYDLDRLVEYNDDDLPLIASLETVLALR